MNIQRVAYALVLLPSFLGMVAPIPAVAGGVADTAARAAARRLLAKDSARDAATRAVPLATDRNLARYVTKEELEVEARSGLKAGQHLAGPSEATTALSAESAKARYGLLHKTPEALEIWRVPKGTPAKVNPALGGEAGATEATLTRPLPPRNLIRVEPLPAGR